MYRAGAILISLSALILGACLHPAPKSCGTEKLLYSPRYAHGFVIAEDTVSHTRLLRVSDQEIVLDRPFSHLSVLSSSHAAMLERAGCSESVVGISGTQYILSQNLRSRIDLGQIREIGSDFNLDLETVTAVKTDMLILYTITENTSTLQLKLSELGIPYIIVGDYTESEPLGKAEWMVALAALCGQMDQGIERFLEIERRYNAVKCKVGNTSLRPKVMVNTPYRDIWYMPSSSNYMIRLIEDAGGEYIYRNDRIASVPISIEEALILVNSADVWLNVGQIESLAELKALYPKFSSAEVVNRKMVFNNDLRHAECGGSDFWESGSVNPDLILSDLIAIFNRTEEIDHLRYYRRLQ